MKNSIMRRVFYLFCSFILLFLISPITACQSKDVKRWSKEWEERYEDRQPSAAIMDSIGIREGMIIGEVGAGNGRLAVKVAARVGENGKVYANDISKEAIDFMRERCEREKIANMVVIEGTVEDPLFPEAGLDMVYMINTYHHLEKPVELLRNIIPALKPHGTLAIIERDPERADDSRSHGTTREILIRQAEEAGYESIRVETFLSEDNIYIFRIAENLPTKDKGIENGQETRDQ